MKNVSFWCTRSISFSLTIFTIIISMCRFSKFSCSFWRKIIKSKQVCIQFSRKYWLLSMFRLEYRDNQCLRFHHMHLPVLISNATLPATFFAHFRNKHIIFLSSRDGNEQMVIGIMCTFK